MKSNNNNMNITMEQQQQQQQLSLQSVLASKILPVDIQKHRLQHGQCLSCGQQLYGFEIDNTCCFIPLLNSRRCSKKEKDLIKSPLTIPGLVHQGKCLPCHIPTPPPTPVVSSSLSPVSPGSLGETPHMDQKTIPIKGFPSDQKTILVISSSKTKKVSPSLFPNPANTAATTTATKVGATHIPYDGSSRERKGVIYPKNSLLLSTLATYHGEYNNKGERHGQGTITWANNGDIYQGSFVNNKRQGYGILTMAFHQGEYSGEWKNDHMHGQGRRKYPNGDVYVGEYYQGKRHGQGKFYHANGDIYSGPWDNNHMQGIGRYQYRSGQYFEGMFINSKRYGMGSLETIDGSTKELFQYINDERVGQGIRWNTDHTKAWKLQILSTGMIHGEPISILDATQFVQELEESCHQLVEEIMLKQLLNE